MYTNYRYSYLNYGFPFHTRHPLTTGRRGNIIVREQKQDCDSYTLKKE